MVIYRSNGPGNGPASTPEERVAAVERHHERGKPAPAVSVVAHTTAPRPMAPQGDTDPGDIIYGAKAIARFIFGEDDNRTRRRVFNLWAHYCARQERAGFFKLKGALCLSKSQWRGFHGL